MSKITGFLMMIVVAVSMTVTVSAQTLEDVERARIDAERARIIAERVRLDEESKQFEVGLRPTTDRTRIVAEKAQLDAESKRLDMENALHDELLKRMAREATEELRVYEIKHQQASELANLIPANSFNLITNSEFNTISLVAVPQVHEMIASIIQKYDVPRRIVEFQFFLIKANTDTEKLNGELPEKLQTVLNEVASLTRYKNFELIDAPFLRFLEGSSKPAYLSGQGNINFDDVKISGEANKRQIRIGSFRASFKGTNISSAIEITEDEMTVIAISNIGNNNNSIYSPSIVIVTAKIL